MPIRMAHGHPASTRDGLSSLEQMRVAVVEGPRSQAEALDLWKRLTEEDPTASEDLVVAYLDWLGGHLARSNPRVDRHDCDTAAEDTLLDLMYHPTHYDPRKAPLANYLWLGARRDLLNLLNREKPHRDRRANLEVVELLPDRGNDRWDETGDPTREIEDVEEVEELRRRVPAAVIGGFDPDEARMFEFLRRGERRTAVIAVALGLDELAVDEQRRRVKQLKDRVKKRLERGGRTDV